MNRDHRQAIVERALTCLSIAQSVVRAAERWQEWHESDARIGRMPEKRHLDWWKENEKNTTDRLTDNVSILESILDESELIFLSCDLVVDGSACSSYFDATIKICNAAIETLSAVARWLETMDDSPWFVPSFRDDDTFRINAVVAMSRLAAGAENLCIIEQGLNREWVFERDPALEAFHLRESNPGITWEEVARLVFDVNFPNEDKRKAWVNNLKTTWKKKGLVPSKGKPGRPRKN